MSIAAVVLAAGLSSRMGQSKALLDWDNNLTVIEQILLQLQQMPHILVVTGHEAEKVTTKVTAMGIATVYNPDYATGEMLSSLKVGLRVQPESVSAVLVVLGDQPRLKASTVQQILDAYVPDAIVAPRYQGQRGHPILISRRYWNEILALPEGGAPRDVIQQHRDVQYFVEVDNDSILSDIDTPEDYLRERRRAGLS